MGFSTVIPLCYGDIVASRLKGELVGGSILVFGAVTLTIPLLHLSGNYLADYADLLSNFQLNSKNIAIEL